MATARERLLAVANDLDDDQLELLARLAETLQRRVGEGSVRLPVNHRPAARPTPGGPDAG